MRVRGLTLLEVVIALLLFALMSTVLLTGQGTAARAVERAEVMRDMAELLGFRLNMYVLQPDDYDDGDSGEFPAAGKSTRLVDEDAIFGSRYVGYYWEMTIQETIGAGASGSVTVDGQATGGPLFGEEGGGGGGGFGDDPAAGTGTGTGVGTGVGTGTAEDDVQADAIDRMLLVTVTVYPPGWDESDRNEKDVILPRSAWTAIHLVDEADGSTPSNSGANTSNTGGR